MNLRNAVKLMEKYDACPVCGNIYINNGEGSLEIEKNYLKRTCKCGWVLEAIENKKGMIEITKDTYTEEEKK